MPPFVSALLAILPAILAFLAYRYFVNDKGGAKKSAVVLPTTPPSRNNAKLEAHRASDFPDDWWTGSELYELECRAIFSKQWLYLTHRSHFSKPGDYHTFQLARYPVFLILGKDHVIRAFHNVCRHRAYTVTKKKSGSSTVLGCRYHGWSYDTRGRLVKAPAFEDIESFDKSQNGLFEIHAHTTRQGFVFVNLSTEYISIPDFTTADVLAKSWGISERSAPLAQLDFEEDVNWKQAVHHMERTGYAARIAPSAWLDLTSKMPFLSTMAAQDTHSILDRHGLSSLHVTSGGRLWYTLSTSPASASRTAFACHIYLNWPGDNAQADVAIQAIRDEVQAMLSTAVEMPPPSKSLPPDAPADGLQEDMLEEMTKHLKEERRRGREVWPASRESSVSDKYNQADLRKSYCTTYLPAPPLSYKEEDVCNMALSRHVLTVDVLISYDSVQTTELLEIYDGSGIGLVGEAWAAQRP
ncbi:iron-sulfur cluster-binding [Diplodia corticola]|uniref:Iron-sulfur cluster-binding n=1 Tax=Diplodia corticola TaxID=236234 RepID=A0A1J9RQR7_9PEZI|nr:iron-sulfur cluster-binding [Diplodia corticola]OJD34867.1 iron-sulfur cluster-binding [Diplodia corticola]